MFHETILCISAVSLLQGFVFADADGTGLKKCEKNFAAA